jgi:hypothetical protein
LCRPPSAHARATSVANDRERKRPVGARPLLRSSLRLWLLAAPYPVAARHQLFMACSVHAPPSVNAVTVSAGALCTPPGVFEGRALALPLGTGEEPRRLASQGW